MTTYAGSVDYAVGVDFTAGARSGTRTATVDFGMPVAFTATTRPTITDARLVVVDKDGAVYGELGDATLTDLSWALSDIESFSFSLRASSGQVALLTASAFREVQVLWGNWLACWGPVTRMDLDGDVLKCSGAGAPCYLQHRYLSDQRTNLTARG